MATEDATTPLLDSYPPSTRTNRYIPIEVIIVLYFLSMSCLIPVQQYYVISMVAKEYNESGFINHGSVDCKSNRTETKSVGDLIEEKSTEILMYLGFCSTFLSVVPIIFLGAVADRLGRKSVICFCLVGLIIKEIVNIVVIHFQLSFSFLYIGQVVEGLTGSFGAMMMSLFGMTADITSPGKNRALRISVVEGIAAITFSVGTLGIGYWIRYDRFYLPMLFICSVTIICVIFCVFFLPETSRYNNNNEIFVSSAYLFRSLRLYTDSSPIGRRWKLLTSLFILAMTGAAIMGRSGTVILFLMRYPLCWNEVKIQVFGSIQTFMNWGAVIVVVRVLHVFMQDYGILVIGSISATSAFLFLALATHDWMVYMCKYSPVKQNMLLF